MDLGSAVSGSQGRRPSRAHGSARQESSCHGKRGRWIDWAPGAGKLVRDDGETIAATVVVVNSIALIHARTDFVARIADPVSELRRQWMANIAPEPDS
jgi:hypothetical protein